MPPARLAWCSRERTKSNSANSKGRSVGSRGDSYDNAAAEAVNSLYKKELISREGPWSDAGHVMMATAEWVSWYNRDRLHSACGNIPPEEYENDWLASASDPIMELESQAS